MRNPGSAGLAFTAAVRCSSAARGSPARKADSAANLGSDMEAIEGGVEDPISGSFQQQGGAASRHQNPWPQSVQKRAWRAMVAPQPGQLLCVLAMSKPHS